MKKDKRQKRIPLYDIKLSSKAIKEAVATLKSGWLSPGVKVAAFERAICKLMQIRYGAAVSSASAGMQLVLRLSGAQPGKEVVTSPFTFVATIEAIIAAGASPVFADIDRHSLNIDPEEAFRKTNERTIAVMPVDIGGYPSEYSLLNNICSDGRLLLIADAAHSIGAAYMKKPVPKYADAAVISFHATKNLICGEGGIVVSSNKALIEAVRLLAQHGLTSSAYGRKALRKWEYDAVGPGLKANMSEIHAAIGLGQLSVFEREQKKRQVLAKRYIKNLADYSEYLEVPQVAKHIQHGWHLFIIKLHLSRLKIDRNTFINYMSRYGIECGVHFKPIFELSYYREALDISSQFFPNAAYAGKRVVSLPLYPSLTFAEVDEISESAIKIVKKQAR